MKLRLLLGSSLSLVLAVACTGASTTELFSEPASAQSGTLPADETTAGSEGSSGGATSGSSTSSSSSSSSSSSGSTTSSSGGTKDAGLPPPPPPPPPTGGIGCGTSAAGAKVSCTPAAQVCCASFNDNGKPEYTCEPSGITSCFDALSIECDDKTDCPSGKICCGSLDNSGYTSVSCQTTCTSTPGSRAVRFCDPKAAVDECVASGKYCGPSQTLVGFSVCRD